MGTEDRAKTKQQLIKELRQMRQRITALESSEAAHKSSGEALRESEERFRQLAENICGFFWLSDPEATRMIYVSPGYEEIWGRTCQSLYERPRSFLDAVHAQDLELVVATFKEQMQGLPVDVKYRIVRPDGEMRWIWSRGFPVRNELGEVYRIAGIAEDITGRKRGREKLRASEARFRTLLEAIPESMLVHDEDGNILHINRFGAERLEWPAAEIVGRNLREIVTPENAQRIPDNVRHARTQGVCHFETTYVSRTGRRIEAEVDECPIEFEGKSAILSMARDITERKRAEEELRQSKQLFERIFVSQRDAIFVLDAKAPPTILECNPAATEAFGYARQEMLGRTIIFLHVDENALARFQEDLYAAITETGFLHLLEFSMKRKDGTVFPTEHSVMPLEDEHGNRTGWVSVVRDITERKRAEEGLRESERKYRTLFEESKDTIYMTNRDGEFLDINQAGLDMFGYTRQKMLTINAVHMYANPSDRHKFQQTIEQKGTVRDYEVNLRKKGGTAMECLVTSIVRRAEDGAILGYQGIIRDTTPAKEAYRKLRRSRGHLRALAARLQSVREEERTQLAREIHDELGHALAALNMDIAWLDRRTSQAVFRERLGDMKEVVDNAIRSVRQIAARLRPAALDDLGLAAAMEWEVRQFKKRTGIECQFTCSLEDVELGPERSTALFRICQEVLTNVARHANATAVMVSLKRWPDHAVLDIADNGRGIRQSEISSAESLGILGMRERALAFGGELRISGSSAKGTTVTVRIPQKGGQ